MSKDYVLRTTNLTKKFGKKVAVNQVNMNIERGDIYGFIGRNGAGKTTLMRTVLGTAFYNEGEIELFGSKDLPEGRKKIGSLIEAPGLYGNCTAYENMKRFSIIYGGTDKDIQELLEFVGLADVGKKKAKAFSLGMKQRLGIAIALLGNPEFLVLDEPINGLDPAGIVEIRDLIIRLNTEKKITVLISSHLLDELAKVVTKYGIINDGVLVEEVSAQELARRCQKTLKIVTDNAEKAVKLIKEIVPEQDVAVDPQDGSIRVSSHVEDSAIINKKLVESGIMVSEVAVCVYGLEDYFVERIGA